MTERPDIRQPTKVAPTVRLDSKQFLSLMASLSIYDNAIGGSVQRELAPNFVTNMQKSKAAVKYEKNVAEERLSTAKTAPSSSNTTINVASDLVCRGSALKDVTNKKTGAVLDQKSKKRHPPVEEPISSKRSAKIASTTPEPVRFESSQKSITDHIEMKERNLARSESTMEDNKPFKNAFSSFRATRIRATIIHPKTSPTVATNAAKVKNDADYKNNKENRQPHQKVISPLVTNMCGAKQGPSENTLSMLKEKHSLPAVKARENTKELTHLSFSPKLVVEEEKPSKNAMGVNHWRVVAPISTRMLQANSPKRQTSTLGAIENLQCKTTVLSQTEQFLLTRPPAHPIVAETMKRKAQKSKVEKYIGQGGDKKYRSCLMLLPPPPPPPPIIRTWDRKPK